MASYYKPDWVGGTITLTSGSKAFTVADVDLSAISVQPGDEIYHTTTGRWLIIDEVTSATGGNLAYNCPADLAGAALPLRIRFQADGSRFAAAYLNVLQKFKGGNLDAFGGLTGAADMFPYFTGAGTMDLAAGSDAYAVLGTIPELQLPARLQGFSGGITNNDYNQTLASGLYGAAGTSSINGPPDSAIYGSLLVIRRNSNTITQCAFGIQGAASWTRDTNDGGSTWTAWSQLYDADHIVGTVSKSGSTPTGAIIEQGSNSNGLYTRFADGTQICSNSVAFTPTASSAFADVPVTYAAAFTSAPRIVTSMASLYGNQFGFSYVNSAFSASATLRAVDLSSNNSASLSSLMYTAFGRWG